MNDATLERAREDPWSTWRAFGPLRAAVVDAQPNAAHLALTHAERRLPEGGSLTVITQNVDGLHQAAGSSTVIELHGNLLRTRCSVCDLKPFADEVAPSELPHCPACGAALRPDIVLFDEPMPARQEWEAKQALRDCDLFLAIGTSGTVSPASNFVRSAEYEGARTIYVNLEPLEPPNPMFAETVLGRAEDVLPTLLGVTP
jgi:NAD-dependent deacetylase